MNQHALLHIPESKYCFAKSKNEVELRLRTARGEDLSVFVVYSSKYYFATRQEKALMKKCFSDNLYDYHIATLTLSDVRLVYIFEIQEKEKIWYFSEDGICNSYDYSLSYYNCFQLPYINAADIHNPVPWMSSAVFYQIFVDRFAGGDTKKDCSYITMNWGDIPSPNSFAGGDIQGIIQKLPYIQSVGINALYLTPIFYSVSNHKYDIIDYKTVDGHFGCNSDLCELVTEAKKRGMRVVLDAVFNHCSEKHFAFLDVKKHGKKSQYFDWFLIDGEYPNSEKKNYECFGDCYYMPKFNTSNLEVQEYLIDIATWWIKEFNIDGWRLDVSDEVSHDFWKKFKKAVKGCNNHAIIIGENWHDANPFLRGDEYDSIMNYAFTKACLDYFAFDKFDAKAFTSKLSEIIMRNTTNVNTMMLNLLDSHDTHRFLTRVDGDKDKLLAALAACIFFLGAPCIYYGTEIPMEGGYDPDCRRTFDEKEIKKAPEFFEKVQKLLQLKKLPALCGQQISFDTVNGLAVLFRGNGEDKIMLYINRTGSGVRFDGETIFSNLYENGVIEPNGFVVTIN